MTWLVLAFVVLGALICAAVEMLRQIRDRLDDMHATILKHAIVYLEYQQRRGEQQAKQANRVISFSASKGMN